MARTFGATTTDLVNFSTHTAMQSLDLRSHAAWIIITGIGNTAGGRIFEVINRFEVTNTATPGQIKVEFRRWPTRGIWQIDTAISQNVWHHLCITYDYGDVTNNPIIYIDGVSVAITEVGTPSGTLLTETSQLSVGNRLAGSRAWEGDIAEVCWFNIVLSASEVRTLYHFSPMRLSGCVFYAPLYGVDNPEPNLVANGNTGAVTGSTVVSDHPPIAPPFGIADSFIPFVPSGTGGTVSSDLQTIWETIGLQCIYPAASLSAGAWLPTDTTLWEDVRDIDDSTGDQLSDDPGGLASSTMDLEMDEHSRPNSTVGGATLSFRWRFFG